MGTGASADTDFAAALGAVDARLAHVRVSAVTAALGIEYTAALADPGVVRAWVAGHAAITEATYGVCPPGVSGTSVLQYLLDPMAAVATQAAVIGPWVLDLDPGGWSLAVEPDWLYPVAVGVMRGQSRVEPDAAARIRATQEAYRRTARAVATAFPAPGRMSSRQRLGMVEDMWETGLARAQSSARDPFAAPPPVRRRSCCLVYALPGCHECAGCPRLRGH